MDSESPPTAHSAEVVGTAFVEQYYHILHRSPELVYRFYHESSVLSRPDESGLMTSVTTMQGINDKILSMNYKSYTPEIKAVDAQKSYKDGVTVLVTGCLTSEDNLKRKFAQSFFLAPQDTGYYVLNDVFRFVEDGEPLEDHEINNVENVPRDLPILPAEPSHVPNPPAPEPSVPVVEEDLNAAKISSEPSVREIQINNEKEAPEETQTHSDVNDVPVDSESAPTSAQEDAPTKISYASIVKVPRGNAGPTKVYVPTNNAKVAAKKIEKTITPAPAPAPSAASAPNNADVPKNDKTPNEAEGYSIYIRNLPFDTSDNQLETEFKRFGPIKPGGIQVRSNKQQGYCFGFVEFLSSSAVNDAIQASPVTIGGRQAAVEMKRASTQGGGGRGAYPSRRGGYQNDGSIRGGRGNHGGGRGFGRNDYAVRGEFSHRGRGASHGEGRGGSH